MSLLWENLLRPIITYCHLKSHTGNGPILGLCTWEFIKEREPVTIVQFQKSSAIALPLVYTEKATTGIFKRQKQGRKKKRSRCNRKRNIFMTSFQFSWQTCDNLLVVFCCYWVAGEEQCLRGKHLNYYICTVCHAMPGELESWTLENSPANIYLLQNIVLCEALNYEAFKT